MHLFNFLFLMTKPNTNDSTMTQQDTYIMINVLHFFPHGMHMNANTTVNFARYSFSECFLASVEKYTADVLIRNHGSSFIIK